MRLRRFNARGILEFERLLERLRQGQSVVTPLEFLETNDFSEIVGHGEDFEVRPFDSRLDMAVFVDDAIAGARVKDEMDDVGLWS